MKQPTGLWELFRCTFLTQTIKTSSQMKVASSSTYRNFENHHIFSSFSIRRCQSHLVSYQKFSIFQSSNFEKSRFLTYMCNMYIKWKLETFWIQICYQKTQLWAKILSKLDFQNFCFEFCEEKKFSKANFSEIFFTTHQFMFSNCFKHQKWKLHDSLVILTATQAKQ